MAKWCGCVLFKWLEEFQCDIKLEKRPMVSFLGGERGLGEGKCLAFNTLVGDMQWAAKLCLAWPTVSCNWIFSVNLGDLRFDGIKTSDRV